MPRESEELWRYSRIAELDLDGYTLAPAAGPVIPAALEPLLDAIGPRSALLIGDRAVGPVAEGITVGPGDEPSSPGAVAGEPDALVALNAAFASMLTVRIGRGRLVADPIVALVWAGADKAAHFPRLMIEVEPGAEATVIEIVASPDVASLVVPVTEMEVADGARLRHLTVQVLGPRAWQVATQASRVGRDGDVVSYNVALGGDYARVRSDSTLAGAGGSSRQLAVFFGAGRQMLDFATVQSHQGKHTTSDLLYKGSVAEESHSVYRGLIRVEKGASGTNAFQTNRNLVLGHGAHADSVPTLEIEENDVRCSHASAVGPIDEEQRFYLESRGVPTETAERLIVSGFLDDVLARVPFPPLVPWLRGALAERIDTVRPA
ncbi:MAG TPA: Fe-S cluster assembly protein SufD [Acidimicrobiales bacterium]|jgi:Fe-S cluster assembly protein SufD|nr:Fe-S cluster assembly protein SufD [Acidimicrobiales bacterium]